jgi:hypothetical protein
LIFNLYQRIAIKVGDDEKHVFDRKRLMFTEVAEIEKVSGLSYAEWVQELGRYSAAGIGPLVHILRKRAGTPSDYATLQFNMAEFDAVPLKDDGTEYTPAEVAADLARRVKEANADGDAGPTLAAAGAVAPETAPGLTSEPSTLVSSLNGSGSGRGSGSGSPGRTSSAARRTATPG